MEIFSRRIGNDITSLEFEDQLISGTNTLEDIQSILGETIQYSDISVGNGIEHPQKFGWA